MPILKYDLFCDVTNSFRNDGFMKSGIDFGLKKSFTISHKTLYTKNFLLITSEFVFYFLKITFWMLEYMQKTKRNIPDMI